MPIFPNEKNGTSSTSSTAAQESSPAEEPQQPPLTSQLHPSTHGNSQPSVQAQGGPPPSSHVGSLQANHGQPCTNVEQATHRVTDDDPGGPSNIEAANSKTL